MRTFALFGLGVPESVDAEGEHGIRKKSIFFSVLPVPGRLMAESVVRRVVPRSGILVTDTTERVSKKGRARKGAALMLGVQPALT